MAASATEPDNNTKTKTCCRWAFTLYDLETDPKDWPGIKYLIYQLEKCPTTGREHYQGYVIFKSTKRLAGLKKIHPTCHWEYPKGTTEENWHYCTKPHQGCVCKHCTENPESSRLGGPWSVGTKPNGPGSRTDIISAKAMFDQGKTFEEVFQTEEHHNTILQYTHAYRVYSFITQPKRTMNTLCTISFGTTGVGKSSWLQETYPDAYWKETRDQWWCGYSGQEHVVVDEYYGEWLPHTLLRLLDKTPYTVSIKGSHAQFNSRCIHITTNQNPFDWYKSMEDGMSSRDGAERRKALFRRFTCIVEVKSFTERKYHKYPSPSSEEYEYLRPFFGEWLPVSDSPPALADDDITEIPHGPPYSPLFTPGTSIERPHFSRSITAPPAVPARHYTRAQLDQAIELLEQSDSDSDMNLF